MAKKLKVLAIAAGTGRLGYVFLIGGKLRDWGLSRKASKRPALAAAQTQKWISALEPDVVVTEQIGEDTSKSGKTISLIEAVASTAANENLLDVSVPRERTFKNKYDEARVLGERFPEIKAWIPRKRRIWEPEPRNTVYFEALALAVQVIEGFDRPSAAMPHAA